jgi:hypothetical protein
VVRGPLDADQSGAGGKSAESYERRARDHDREGRVLRPARPPIERIEKAVIGRAGDQLRTSFASPRHALT